MPLICNNEKDHYYCVLQSVSSFLWAQEDSTIVIDDSTDTDLIEQRADTLTVTMDSLEVEDVHPQDSPEHRGFIIRSDDDKSELRLRGSVRLHGVFDLNGLQNQNLFQVYDIPVGDANKTEPRFSHLKMKSSIRWFMAQQ